MTPANVDTPPRTFAIVPAAGRSRRMGSAKQLLDVNGRPMLLAVLEPLLQADIAGVQLVTHQAVAEALGLMPSVGDPELARKTGGPPLQRWVHDLNACKLHVALNDDESTEMIDSVRIGINAWRSEATLEETDGFLIIPADHPGITIDDINRCTAAFRNAPDRIVIATRKARRGHPIIFPASLAPFVESPACDQGLNALPHTHADRITTIECVSPGVTRDIDTPEDYKQMG